MAMCISMADDGGSTAAALLAWSARPRARGQGRQPDTLRFRSHWRLIANVWPEFAGCFERLALIAASTPPHDDRPGVAFRRVCPNVKLIGRGRAWHMLIEAKGRDPDPRANLQTQLGVAASACAARFGAERAAYRSATLAASTVTPANCREY